MIGIRRWVKQRLRGVIKQPTSSKTILFHGEMTIDEAWFAHPNAPLVFERHHLPACDGCSVRFEETLSEAAEAYSIDLAAFLHELNRLTL